MLLILKAIHDEYSVVYGSNTNIVKEFMCYLREPKLQVQSKIRVLMRTNQNTRLWQLRRNNLLKNYNIEIGNGSHIGERCIFPHYFGIVIGKGVYIGDGCTIYQQVTIGKKGNDYPTIKDNVTIFPGAKIVGGG